MGFEVVQGTPYIGWYPVDATDTLYVGQIVTCHAVDGMKPIAAGVYSGNNTYNKPFGVVVGTNQKNPLFDTTYKCEYTVGINPHAQTRELVGQETNQPKGDNQMWVQIAVITPETVLKGPIYNATYGVAPAVGTVTAGNTSGLNCTTTAAYDVAPVNANSACMYCRTGNNMGIYRINSYTSTTDLRNPKAFPFDIAVGDTIVGVPFRHYGQTVIELDAEAMFINSAGNCNNTGWAVNMLRVDLSKQYEEWAMFMFNPISLTVGIAGIDYV